jgi:hypothetical protein
MNTADAIAENILKALPKVPRGTLRFWGAWFGRPHDNVHTVLKCAARQDVLRLYFDEGEVLTVWSPRGFTMDESTFKIDTAERVRWEWFSYGRPKTAANLFFKDFIKTGETVVASTNVNWHTPDLSTNLSLPAVEIVSLSLNLKRTPVPRA